MRFLWLLLLCLACGGNSGGAARSVSFDPDSPLLIYIVNNSSRTHDEVQLELTMRFSSLQLKSSANSTKKFIVTMGSAQPS